MKRLFFVCLYSFLVVPVFLAAQAPSRPDSLRMAWFKDAKLGIFVHWGIYSVDGVDESWSFYNHYLPFETYSAQRNRFTANKYDPVAWAKLFREAGARYAVLTAKHHDGMALWGSRLGTENVVQQTPAKRDLVTPFVSALRAENLRAGLYFSLIDWAHPDYPAFRKNEVRYDRTKDPQRWQRFRDFYQGQLFELSTQFKPDLFWFDGDWEHPAEAWESEKVRAKLFAHNPNVVLNSRLAGHGDYETPEQGIPIVKPKSPYWELCLTANDSWGYQGTDENYKTPAEIIQIFSEVIGLGGNLLLAFGPKEDGTFRPQDLNLMQELGHWTKRNEEAIYGTRAGLPSGHFQGVTTVSKDHKKLYLFLQGRPASGQVMLRGIESKIAFIRVLGSGQKLYGWRMKGKPWWSEKPGFITIDLPESTRFDPYLTVVAIEFKEPIRLHREDKMGLLE
ncbi:MAG: alpha-L-fucosidase [Bacteroidetes Order II. Incertae sedis bacterium]|nr:alpha-L-fucosidase [Bacteroidetes Order II. bacterium]